MLRTIIDIIIAYFEGPRNDAIPGKDIGSWLPCLVIFVWSGRNNSDSSSAATAP
jgi:hypothetical protein